MASSLVELKTPEPPSNLSKETVRVWMGWCLMGDKEVAREAATKGSHIDLVVTFLTERKKLSRNDVELWFKEEILLWVKELLKRKQIYKATHILTNINLDAVEEFVKIFYSTAEEGLREYIGNHLIKIEKLDEKLKQLWLFLKLILKHKLLIPKHNLTNYSIECLDKESESWKASAAVMLFLIIFDTNLLHFLTTDELWKYLIKTDNQKYLLAWINIRNNQKFEGNNLNKNLIELLRNLPITNELLNSDYDNRNQTKIAIYNEFSKFGIFCEVEKNNFQIILKRLKNSLSLSQLNEILSEASITDQFYQQLIEYCLENELFTVLNACISISNCGNIPQLSEETSTRNIQHLKLMKNCQVLVEKFDEEINLRDNIFSFCQFFSDNNYFETNPIILLALIFFIKDLKIPDIQTKTKSFIINGVNLDEILLEVIVKKLPILNNIQTNNNSKNQITLYDLLEKHLKTIVNARELFKFRFNNEPLPYLIDLEFVQKTYTKQINYLYYLKQSRPSIACKIFLLLNQKTINDQTILLQKVFKLALTNFNSIEITSTCVMFLEIIGLNSINLRINLTAAKTIFEAGYYDLNFITNLFLTSTNSEQIQTILEDILIDQIQSSFLSTGAELIEAFKLSEIVLKFSRINQLKLPESFLKYCASKNLWLPFLLYAQLNNYPSDQLKLITQFFKSPNLLEHINHSIINDIQINETNTIMRDRDSRKYLLSKLGVRKSAEKSYHNQSLIISQTNSFSSSTASSSSSSDSFDLDMLLNIKTTLLQILIRCHNGADPPKALLQACQLYKSPLLAIFATSYEPDSVITNWLTWLTVSCNLCETFTNYETIALSANLVSNLLENCMKNRFPKTLMHSFQIFLPENPLRIFMEFLYDLIKFNFDQTILRTKLEEFQNLLKNIRRNSLITNNDHELTYLHNKLWIEAIALRLLAAFLDFNCNSLYEQIIQVENLCKIEFSNYLTIDCPNFQNLFEILKNLYETKTNKIQLNITIIFDNQNYRQAVINCINSLLEENFYEIALKIAEIENLPADLILIKEWQNKFENNKSNNDNKNFWLKCDGILKKYNVTADCVIEFYLDCIEKINNNFEKYSILKLACEWAIKYDLSMQFELEMKMWLAYLNLEDPNKNLLLPEILDNETKMACFLYKDVLEILEKLPILCDYELNIEMQQELEKVQIYSLNHNNFWLALKLQKMFGCKSSDLEILRLCYSLAEGIIMPYQLNSQQRLLVSANLSHLRSYASRRRILLSSNRVSTSHSGTNLYSLHNSDTIETQQLNDVLTILHSLSERLINGKELSQNIFMTYRISLNIEIPYQVVVATANSIKILKDALDDGCMNKLDVVHDFIIVYKWTKTEIADFICEEIINATTNYIQSNNENFMMWDLDMDNEFHLILQLLHENCSILGYRIYSYSNVLHKSQIMSTINNENNNDLSIVIELLIRSHDCFTTDCNMEGISLILKKCQNVISHLLRLKNWKLIVRLLTGVARYTEMNYVFQILNENDHFEFLLRKGSRKDNALKVALLEYLKKYCPDNRDLYKIVALHFTLFSEVALLWEREAQNIINNLISISKLEMQNNKLNPDDEIYVLLTNTDGTKICLNKAMENYAHATEFHLQGEKLSKAMNSAKQAELIALQLSLLKELASGGTAICLLNLSNTQISGLITSVLNFEQSLILIEAYNYHTDWATVLYQQYFVQNNNSIYFESFLQHFSLTESLVHDISRKFVNANVNSLKEVRCMKNILNNLPSVHMKYRIASELGFMDLLEDLIGSDQLVYLKDTVWKKGYKS